MHYIIHCIDKPGALPTRLANYAAHRAYLAAPSVKIVISGPFHAAGIWEHIDINPFSKRMDNRS